MNPLRVLRAKAGKTVQNLPRYRSALRYRLDRNYTRFIAQTVKPLDSQPATRTLHHVAHYDHQGLVDPYVRYYLEALHRTGATIVFVSGSPNLDAASAQSVAHLCAGIYSRHTLSLDFGSWHLAWRILQDRGWSLDRFDRFIVANDSVYGPLFPLEEMFATFTGADMYGPIENLEITPHLQSFFLAWDLNSRTRPFLNSFWNDFQYIVDKQKLIEACEVGLSTRARAAGLTLKPFLNAAQVSAAFPLTPAHQWSSTLAGPSTNNTLYFWDGLIEHLRFPFLKAILPRCNEPWHDSMHDLAAFIERHTPYPYRLIEDNVDRLGCGRPIWTRPPGQPQVP